jgi:hypothetical protein
MSEIAIGDAAAAPQKHARLKTELIKLFWTFLYLYVLFGAFLIWSRGDQGADFRQSDSDR